MAVNNTTTIDMDNIGLTQQVLTGVRSLLAETHLDTVNDQLTQINGALDQLRQQYTDTSTKVNTLLTENKSTQDRLVLSENKVAHLECLVDNLSRRVIDNECRGMTDNLIFHNISEERHEVTREILISFLKEVMKISSQSFVVPSLDMDSGINTVWIKKCHRMGPPPIGHNTRPRPIFVSFVDGAALVLRHARNLAGSNYFVATQMPQEVMENKRKVSTIFKKAKQEGKRPRYVARGDAVAVENRTFRAPTAPRCQLTPADIISKKDELELRSSDIVEERGNRFVAHVATIKSPNDIPVALNAIKYSFHAIATATHNVWAARIQGTEAVAEYSDDDGEHGGAREIAKELRNQNLANHMVVVTRWASGVQLGRKRFDIIAQRTKAVLRKYRASTQTGTKLSTAATTTTPTASISTTSGQQGSVPATSVSTQVHPAQAPVMSLSGYASPVVSQPSHSQANSVPVRHHGSAESQPASGHVSPHGYNAHSVSQPAYGHVSPNGYITQNLSQPAYGHVSPKGYTNMFASQSQPAQGQDQPDGYNTNSRA